MICTFVTTRELVTNTATMATYMPLISAFTQRTSFWPPEAFTLDCRVEERIWEWCERILKENEEFMGLVNSDKPLDMQALWDTISATAYGDLTSCIFHYWLILNWNQYKGGGTICTENADWICARLKIKGPKPWPDAAPAAAVGAGEPAPAPAPDVVGPLSARLDGKFAEPVGPPPPQKNVSVCLTSGSTMTILKLSDVPRMDNAELRKYYRDLQMYIAESWSPEDCDNAGIILEAIHTQLTA